MKVFNLIPLLCLFFSHAYSMEILKQRYSWPTEKPDVHSDNHGWFSSSNQKELPKILQNSMKVVVELGSWLGLSTRYIATHAPNATIIAIDHWLGSIEHHNHLPFAQKLPTLYETFLVNCWAYKNRLIPMRTTTQSGLDELYELGIHVDLFYIDAAHDYQSVIQELEKINTYFPSAIISGDDWSWKSVRTAVQDFARKFSFKIYANGNFYKILK